MNMDQATARVEIDNEFCVVTRWTFAPNTATGWHRHDKDYVVVPTIAGDLTLQLPDGSTVVNPIKAGVPYARPAGVEHDVQNLSGAVVEFLEIEIKGKPEE
jgi:quercetin dioxygenase-like cupin family protein